MLSNSFINKNFTTWDEAFRSLAPEVRQESVRVAEYTQVLYKQAVKNGWGTDSEKWPDRMLAAYDELAFKCGLYHQLGKAYLPMENQSLRKDFTQEEMEFFVQYTEAGAQLVDSLQAKFDTGRGWGKNRTAKKLENIPDMMIMESCAMHLERYDGTGWPAQLSGEDVSPVAYIVGLAKEFDRVVTKTKSENPFDETFVAFINRSDNAFPRELLAAMKKVKTKFREIFDKYIQYSLALTPTVPLVDKREDRPLGLAFKAMVNPATQKPVFYMADPWFGLEVTKTETDKPGNTISALFKRRGILADVCKYFLYEVCDTVLRTENCKLNINGVILNMLPEFYALVDQTEAFDDLFRDQPVDMAHLYLTVAENVVINSPKSVTENIKKYTSHGINIVMTDYHPGRLPVEKIQEYGFKYVLLAKEACAEESLAKDVSMLGRQGIGVLRGETDPGLLENLKNTEILAYIDSDAVSMSEDVLIRESLARENALV